MAPWEPRGGSDIGSIHDAIDGLAAVAHRVFGAEAVLDWVPREGDDGERVQACCRPVLVCVVVFMLLLVPAGASDWGPEGNT